MFLHLPPLILTLLLHPSLPQVRHVTHEVRTPLNTVAIGADVLTHELKQLGDIIPPLLMEVVVGIREASTGEMPKLFLKLTLILTLILTLFLVF